MTLIRYQHPRTLVPRTSMLGRWSGLEDELDRVMNAAFSSVLNPLAAEGNWSYPRADLFEDKEHFYVRAELPGLKKDDIHVELGDGVLTISGARREFAGNGEQEKTSEFSRSLSVPARVQDGSLTARYEDGVLTVTLPKAEEVKPKRIAVQVK